MKRPATHAQADPGTLCGGKLVAVDTRATGAGPVSELYKCEACGAAVAVALGPGDPIPLSGLAGKAPSEAEVRRRGVSGLGLA